MPDQLKKLPFDVHQHKTIEVSEKTFREMAKVLSEFSGHQTQLERRINLMEKKVNAANVNLEEAVDMVGLLTRKYLELEKLPLQVEQNKADLQDLFNTKSTKPPAIIVP